LVASRLEFEPEFLAALRCDREANEAPTLSDHKVDRFRGSELGSQNKVALVLPIFVVANNHHSPAANVFDGFLD
jgi:hypothetical protein